ncbi:hypothetical protein C1Y30_01445 [Pseudomonas sp. GW704-F3]|nr:hypothetical protein C1Y30_01445 [Pseudomonas sp. GW704-F3]PMU96850.1 hypothetical protein C1Y28_05160 [Pseudomonas sp. GW704-F5]PMV05296.1 hypothetical protein C1Y29_09895 [Pseudomonas sp. MPBD4-3]PMV34724.1 hypothetical protein C1Y27_05335 [Pseudomonas sp. GW704-F2]
MAGCFGVLLVMLSGASPLPHLTAFQGTLSVKMWEGQAPLPHLTAFQGTLSVKMWEGQAPFHT